MAKLSDKQIADHLGAIGRQGKRKWVERTCITPSTHRNTPTNLLDVMQLELLIGDTAHRYTELYLTELAVRFRDTFDSLLNGKKATRSRHSSLRFSHLLDALVLSLETDSPALLFNYVAVLAGSDSLIRGIDQEQSGALEQLGLDVEAYRPRTYGSSIFPIMRDITKMHKRRTAEPAGRVNGGNTSPLDVSARLVDLAAKKIQRFLEDEAKRDVYLMPQAPALKRGDKWCEWMRLMAGDVSNDVIDSCIFRH